MTSKHIAVTVGYQLCRSASLIYLGLATLSTNGASARPAHPRYAPCPTAVVVPPPPCNIHLQGATIVMNCTASGVYWFSAALAGFGCAGALSNINLGMANFPVDSGRRTTYLLTYNLYTGNGFQQDLGGFHIDLVLKDGRVIPDILAGRFDFDFSRCWYNSGQDFRVPPGFPATTKFDFTKYNVANLAIRVDPATRVGNSFHC
jgi:hypothetical protein